MEVDLPGREVRVSCRRLTFTDMEPGNTDRNARKADLDRVFEAARSREAGELAERLAPQLREAVRDAVEEALSGKRKEGRERGW